MGIEPIPSAWKADVLADILHGLSLILGDGLEPTLIG